MKKIIFTISGFLLIGIAIWILLHERQRNPVFTDANILLITPDQHRRNSAGCYGNRDVITLGMDRMAREGVRFTECMTAAPLCAPTERGSYRR